MNVVIAFPSAFVDKRALALTIKEFTNEISDVVIEGNYIICRSKDPVDFAFRVARLFGVEKVAVAKKVSSKYSEVTRAIVEIGVRVIKPGSSFYIKVIQESGRHDYVSRDIEFAACGTLTARLSSVNTRPAKSEADAEQLLLVIVGKKSAYVCIQLLSAPGGLLRSSNGRALSSIHGSLSFLSSLMAARAGFESTIVLPYIDETDLEHNAKLAELFASITRRKKQTILLMPINLPRQDVANFTLIKEKMISQIMINQEETLNVFPFTIAVHPVWFIETIMQETLSAGKTPFMPLIFMSNEIFSYAREIGIELDIVAGSLTLKEKLQRFNDTIDREAKAAIKHSKKLELTVGPNYLHDIIDSI